MDYRSFLKLAVASRLLNRSDLLTMRRDFTKVRKRGTTAPERFSLLTTYLIERRLLTPWQCTKLAEGRYKGFFLGRYKLLDRLGGAQATERYLAENIESGERVEISVARAGHSVQLSVVRGGKVIETALVERERGGHGRGKGVGSF
jgi:eukaryotic-like serine/threonine-protein kinase